MENLWIVILFKQITTYKLDALIALSVVLFIIILIHTKLSEFDHKKDKKNSWFKIAVFVPIALIINIEIFQLAWYVLSSINEILTGFMNSNSGKW